MVLQNINGWFLLAEIVMNWSGLEPRHQGVFVFVFGSSNFLKHFLGNAHVQSKLRASELDTLGVGVGERTEELMWVQWKNREFLVFYGCNTWPHT